MVRTVFPSWLRPDSLRLHVSFCLILLLSFSSFVTLGADEGVLLRYKPRQRESIYTFYSRAETLLKNGAMEKVTQTSSQMYLSQITMQVVTNGNMMQHIAVSAGNITMGDRLFAHPAVGQFLEFIQTPRGGVPKVVGNGNQFSVKNLQFELPEHKVSVGTTWSVTIPPVPTFPIATTSRYQVVNMLGDLVIIRAKIDLEPTEFTPGMAFAMKGTSQIIFHSLEGMILRSESNQYLEVVLKSKNGAERSTRMNQNSILELQF